MWEPLKNDGNSQAKNSSVPCVSYEEIERQMVVHEMTMHSIEESHNAPLNIPASSTTKIINDKEEYDDALDDGPILPKNPPCLEISKKKYMRIK